MAYLKPQSPIIVGTDHIYPLTTIDQIIMEDGTRWNGEGLSDNNYSIEEKIKLAGIQVNAEENQNAFSTITIGSTAIAADSKTDTFTIVAGSNITLTPDATNDKMTIAATDTKYSAGTGLALSGTTFNHSNSVTAATASEGGSARTLAFGGSFNVPSVTYDAQGHITGNGSIALKLPSNPNTDTGATSVEVTGSGNAVTAASYDASTRKLTLTKGSTYNNYSLPTASSSTLGGVKIGSNVSISNGTISVPTATGTSAGVTIVHPAASCTTFSSDSNTVTPLAVQKGAKMFAITRPPKKDTAETVVAKKIARWQNAEGDLEDTLITIEDVTNTRDTSKKAQVITIPAEGDKKMVYGYCTDQIDGTSFIGGVFDKDATSYPYNAGLAIGGTSGNLLWKGSKVISAADLAAGSTPGVVKTTSTVTSTSGLTACPIIGGVPYYKDTNNTYSLSSFGITATAE